MVTFPKSDPVMLDLLLRWEEHKSSGQDIDLAELCKDCPERLPDLELQIEQLQRLDGLLSLTQQSTILSSIPGIEFYEELGRGGMGTVYRAKQLTLDRIVAIKTPHTYVPDAAFQQRFDREARVLAKLRHPQIVPIYAAEFSDGHPYIIMEYIAGGSLAERMNEVAATPQQTAMLMAKVARAVGYAHSQGIIHRDLKPSNILLNESGEPFVSDFGVAALLTGESISVSSGDTPDDREVEQTQLTRTGRLAGTPAYSAPEMFEEGTNRSHPTADVWSLGVVLYQCLVGQLPYQTIPTLKPATPPALPRTLRSSIPASLKNIVLRCLELRPEERFQSATELAEQLERWVRRDRVITSRLCWCF
jgi:eukaryotic-like serine/threonine-protein kinase